MPNKQFGTLRKFNRAVLNPFMKAFISGKYSYYSLLYHVGRRSGKNYETPVVAVKQDAYVYTPLPYGADTDWFLNVRAAGQCRVKIQGRVYSVNQPEIVDASTAAPAFPSDFRAKIEKTKLNQFLRLSVTAR